MLERPLGLAGMGRRARGRRYRPNDQASSHRSVPIVVVCSLSHKCVGDPAFRPSPAAINEPAKSKVTVVALSALKRAKSTTAAVTQSTVRANLPAILMTASEFGWRENRCAGIQKNTRRKMKSIQAASSASSTCMTKAHETE